MIAKVLVALLAAAHVAAAQSHEDQAPADQEQQPPRDELDALRQVIPGEPGKDYPIFSFESLHKANAGGNQKSSSSQQRQSRAGNFGSAEAGSIPGVPGRDYPVNSLAGLKKAHPNIQLAPQDLVVKGFPYPQGGSPQLPAHLPRPPRPQGQPPRRPAPAPQPQQRPQPLHPQQPQPQPQPLPQPLAADFPAAEGNSVSDEQPLQYCPGGGLDHCIDFCPRETYADCVARCGATCA